MQDFADRAALVRRQEVGRQTMIETPFGRRRVCYADLTATGRYLAFVERWIRRVRGFYANTHTAVASTGALMGSLREEARRVIHQSVHAGPDDRVLFCGSGATAAVHKLVGLLGLRISEPLERDFQLSRHIPPAERPIVFVGPYEHHSNELPWRESVAEVVTIDLDASGRIDLADLERKAALHPERRHRIGAFSAASNVTGVLTDVPAVARILHRHGALAVFDYAASGPYVPIDMHPADPEARLDAIFLSTHKFMAGPQASGVLVASRALFRTRIPERPGGGTVDYVSRSGAVDYVDDLLEREEGGTPAIMGDIRAGAAFLVKAMLGPEAILAHELAIARMALARLARHPKVRLLGPLEVERLAIVSFNIEGLHHDLVAALLDHLFGIQNRAGCSCAGPYGHRLLAIDDALSERFRGLMQRRILGMKPGWVRLSLPYYATSEDLDFILSAVEFVADRGAAFVPCYRFGWHDGVWRHIDHPRATPPPLTLTVEALLAALAPGHEADDADEPPLDDATLQRERQAYLAQARELADALEARWKVEALAWNPSSGDAEVDALVWFDHVHSEGLPA